MFRNSPDTRPGISKKSKLIICGELLVLSLLCLCLLLYRTPGGRMVLSAVTNSQNATPSQSQIKWVDFNVTSQAMNQAFRYDVDTCQADIHINWVDLLAYLGARYGGDFSHYKAADMEAAANRLLAGETIEDLTKDMKYYSYYRSAYGAVLDGMVGLFQAEIPSNMAPGALLPSGVDGGDQGDPPTVWVTKYGLKAYSPIAKGFPYSDFDDFGVSRSYGFRRQHLGHDFLGQVGTPIIAVESGWVEAMGWNQYGGWRLGIRSFDNKRYYYYAHLRKDYPYQSNLQPGSYVQAGDVIGYMGRTGYSSRENTNNIDESHLHFGIQLIFDESQKESNSEIWINCYELAKFLSQNRCETVKVQGTKEWTRVYGTDDPVVPDNGVQLPASTPSQAKADSPSA